MYAKIKKAPGDEGHANGTQPVLWVHHTPTPERLADLRFAILKAGWTFLRACSWKDLDPGQVRRIDPDLAALRPYGLDPQSSKFGELST